MTAPRTNVKADNALRLPPEKEPGLRISARAVVVVVVGAITLLASIGLLSLKALISCLLIVAIGEMLLHLVKRLLSTGDERSEEPPATSAGFAGLFVGGFTVLLGGLFVAKATGTDIYPLELIVYGAAIGLMLANLFPKAFDAVGYVLGLLIP